jgi:hypothetical protein
LRIVRQAVTICAVVESNISKEPMGSLWRGVVHIGGLITGDSQTLLVTSAPLAIGQAFDGVRTNKGVSMRFRERNKS